MKFSRFLPALASVSMIATPAMAAPASSSAANVQRVAASTDEESNLTGIGGLGIVPLLLAVGVIIGGIIIAADSDDDDSPVSP